MSVGSLRRSSRLSAAMLPQASPCSNYLSPRRVTRRSLALAQTPVNAASSPAQLVRTPAQIHLTLKQTPAQAPKSQHGTPQSSQKRKDTGSVSLCFPPVKEVRADDTQPEGSRARQAETVLELSTPTPVPSIPSISVAEEHNEPAEAVNMDLPISPRLSLSPCKTPLPASRAPEPSSSLSFTLSPCVTSGQPPAVQGLVEAQESVCHTPDNSVVEVNTFSCFCILSLRGRHLFEDVIQTVFSCHTINTLFSCYFRKFLVWTSSDISSLHKDAAYHRGQRLP